MPINFDEMLTSSKYDDSDPSLFDDTKMHLRREDSLLSVNEMFVNKSWLSQMHIQD